MIEGLLKAVSEHFEITEDEIRNGQRGLRVDARGVVCYILRSRGWVYEDIGVSLDITHSSALQMVKRIQAKLKESPGFQLDIDKIVKAAGKIEVPDRIRGPRISQGEINNPVIGFYRNSDNYVRMKLDRISKIRVEKNKKIVEEYLNNS